MIDQGAVPALAGMTVLDAAGEKIGKVGDVYLDDATGDPEWVTVRFGRLGNKEIFVPLVGADVSGDELVVAVSKDDVKNAPKLGAGGHLEPEEESELYRFYGLRPPTGFTGQPAETVVEEEVVEPEAPVATTPTAAPGDGRVTTRTTEIEEDVTAAPVSETRGTATTRAPETGEEMTRSEEHLRVSTEELEAGRARLHKYVQTETEQVTIPLTHEEVRIEREPITERNRPRDRSEIGEAEFEVILHAERPVVHTEVEPVERIRLAKQTVTQQETVSGTIRKEQIEVEDGTESRLRGAPSTRRQASDRSGRKR